MEFHFLFCLENWTLVKKTFVQHIHRKLTYNLSPLTSSTIDSLHENLLIRTNCSTYFSENKACNRLQTVESASLEEKS